jgi:enoyl-CoA hydratase/carnithine racemase
MPEQLSSTLTEPATVTSSIYATPLTSIQAMQTILLAKPITAEEGLSHGLVCQLFEDGTVLDNTVKVAADLAANATEAMQLAKEAICRGMEYPDSSSNFCQYHHLCYR